MFNKDALIDLAGMEIYPSSVIEKEGVTYFLSRDGVEKFLCLVSTGPLPSGFQGEEMSAERNGAPVCVRVCPLTHANADALRDAVPFTCPRILGVKKSVGFGDRLGLATPGHIHAVKGTGVEAVLAQQSMREMARTERTPEEVMDGASWGVFQEGFVNGFGADADHLKTIEDINVCVNTGFTMFTVDPGEYVDDEADTCPAETLEKKYGALPWKELEITSDEHRKLYAGRSFPVADDFTLELSEEALLRSGVKYLAAVAHTVKLHRHLKSRKGNLPFELEMSVDETATPTSVEAHFLVASELKRLGVRCVSLAPRFVGEFEKGVDYIGDLTEFERTFARHAAIARHLGPYKISLHSGSDKFSVYPIAARLAGDLVHVKTAGTSYLEALRVIAAKAPELFREILVFALGHYETDKATYHVSADLAKIRKPEDVKDGGLNLFLDKFDARQVFHVTFGSVLTFKEGKDYLFRDRFYTALRENEEDYYRALEIHLGKHVKPFI